MEGIKEMRKHEYLLCQTLFQTLAPKRKRRRKGSQPKIISVLTKLLRCEYIWGVEIFFLVTKTALDGPGLSCCSGFEVTLNYKSHITLDSSGRGIGPSQRSRPDKTRHSQATDFHALDWVRSGIRNNGEVADLRLRPNGHRDRRVGDLTPRILNLGTRNLRMFNFMLLPL